MRFLKDGAAFREYPLEKKDEFIAGREARRGGAGGGRPQYGGGPGREFTREKQIGERERAMPRGGPPSRGPRAGNSRHTVFIGNIAYDIEKSEIEELLKSEVGGVQRVSLVMDPDGRSKGFAFADMESEDAVSKAVDELNGYEMDGRALTVRVGRSNN